MRVDEVVDASLFLGMHSEDESMREACKGFFAARITGSVVMSWEQVGRCDDLVWSYPRGVQDAYYPFMDVLHTDMEIRRSGYDDEDLRAASAVAGLGGLPAHERLLLGLVLRRGGVLYTVSPRLRERRDLPVNVVAPPAVTAAFPDHLEELYQRSLVLRVHPREL